MREHILKALIAKYEAAVAEHKINIEVLLDKQVGVAEHPGIIETLDGEIQKLAEAEDKLLNVRQHFVTPPAPKVV